MKKLALGIVAAATLMTAAAPRSMAQVRFYAGPGRRWRVGIGAPITAPPYGYYDYYGGPRAVVTPGWHRNWHHHWR